MARYIVESNALYGMDLEELITLGLAAKKNMTPEEIYWAMYSDCYLMVSEFKGVIIKYYEKDEAYVATSDLIYHGSGKTELEALQNYLKDKDDFSRRTSRS